MKIDLLWYERLGFDENPFSIKPAIFHDELFGLDEIIKQVKNGINEGKIIFIGGKYGSGKTTLLKSIIREYKGHKRVIYYNSSQTESTIDLDSMLYNRYGFLGRLFKVKPKNMILLLDEVQNLNIRDIDRIDIYHEKSYFKSVVLASSHIDKVRFSQEIKDVVKDNFFEFNGLKSDAAITLIRRRIGNIQLVPDEVIKLVNTKSDSPRQLLKNMEDVCRYAVHKKRKVITVKVVNAVLK